MKMKFALVNEQKAEPQPGLKGICTFCHSNMIAQCGTKKNWHWAHKSKATCDPWWENETAWHRAWKNQFPMEWQEIIHIDSATGEKHKADIKTASGLVIEFQYSAIQPAEMQSREAFYKNMVWIVNGTRLKKDYPRFCKEFSSLRPIPGVQGFFLLAFPEECFPENWLTCSVPVYFDFQSNNSIDQQDQIRSLLWCLFPDRVEGSAVIAGVSRKQLIELASANPYLLFAHEALSNISKLIRLQRQNMAGQQARTAYPRYVRRRSRRF